VIPSDLDAVSPRLTLPTVPGLGFPDLSGLPLAYRQAILNDPVLRAQLMALSGQGTSNMGARTAARDAAIAQFGEVPTDVGFTVNALTRALAQKATAGGVSTVAQLARTAAQTRANDLASLGARGMIHSGALGTHLANDAQTAAIAQFNARKALTDQLNGAQDTYLTGQNTLRGQVAGDVGSSLTRQIAAIRANQIIPAAKPAAPTGAASFRTPPIATPHAPPSAPYAFKPLV
jgi:hypothetical protein